MYRSTLRLVPIRPDANVADLLPRFVLLLKKVRGRDITVFDDKITFVGGIVRWLSGLNNWNLLIAISRGEIVLDCEQGLVRYGLSFTQFLVLIGLIFLLFGLALVFNGTPLATVLTLLPTAGALLAGANVLTSVLRFDSAIRRVLREAGFRVISGILKPQEKHSGRSKP
jgi:hypothetical protein